MTNHKKKKSKGIPLSVISEGMGHDSEATTQIYLADLDTAACKGKEYLAAAIAAGSAYSIGHGHGPVHHFHPYY